MELVLFHIELVLIRTDLTVPINTPNIWRNSRNDNIALFAFPEVIFNTPVTIETEVDLKLLPHPIPPIPTYLEWFPI